MPNATERLPVRLFTPAPYLRVHDAPAAIAFYATVFGVREIVRLTEPTGRVAHAELRLGDATLMLSDEYPEYGIRGPHALGGTSVALQLYVEDVEALCARAQAAGGRLLVAAALDPFGDRAAKLEDPFGHLWLLATREETLSAEEMRSRFERLLAPGSG
jgi:PhnB protein